MNIWSIVKYVSSVVCGLSLALSVGKSVDALNKNDGGNKATLVLLIAACVVSLAFWLISRDMEKE